jgi:hypothetical protein
LISTLSLPVDLFGSGFFVWLVTEKEGNHFPPNNKLVHNGILCSHEEERNVIIRW